MSKVTELLSALVNGEQIEDFTPTSRMESYLKNCCLARGSDGLPKPISRADALLYSLAEKIASGGSGGSDEWFNDGNTHIWITLPEGRTSPMLGVGVYGTVTVDWGDGTTPDTLTGTGANMVKWTPTHEYAKAGDYVITLSLEGMQMSLGGISSGSSLLCSTQNGAGIIDDSYRCAVRKVEMGEKCTLSASCFASLFALASVAISKGTTYLGAKIFMNCYCLTSVAFSGSESTISSQAFTSSRIRYFDFTKHTKVPTLQSGEGFQYAPSDYEIRVPAALYDEWVAATNWATYASKIVAV